MQFRFTDPRTIQKMNELSVDTNIYLALQPSEKGAFFFPDRIWQYILK